MPGRVEQRGIPHAAPARALALAALRLGSAETDVRQGGDRGEGVVLDGRQLRRERNACQTGELKCSVPDTCHAFGHRVAPALPGGDAEEFRLRLVEQDAVHRAEAAVVRIDRDGGKAQAAGKGAAADARHACRDAERRQAFAVLKSKVSDACQR